MSECSSGNVTCAGHHRLCYSTGFSTECVCEDGWVESAVLSKYYNGALVCTRNVTLQSVLYAICIILSTSGITLQTILLASQLREQVKIPFSVVIIEGTISFLLLVSYCFFLVNPKGELFGERNVGNVAISICVPLVFIPFSFRVGRFIQSAVEFAKARLGANISSERSARVFRAALSLDAVCMSIPIISLVSGWSEFWLWLGVCMLAHETSLSVLLFFTIGEMLKIYDQGLAVVQPGSATFTKIKRTRKSMLILRKWRVVSQALNIMSSTMVLAHPQLRAIFSGYLWIISAACVELNMLQLARHRLKRCRTSPVVSSAHSKP